MYPRNYFKVYGLDPSDTTREDVIGKKVILISSNCDGARKLNLSKMGTVVSIVEYADDIKKKIRHNDPFMVKLDNGKLLACFSIFIFGGDLIDSVKNNLKKLPHKTINHNPAFPKPFRRNYRRYLNGSFTCYFLFTFFKNLIRDINLGWDNLPTENDLFREIPEYTGEPWNEKNTRLFSKLYNFTKEHC